MNKSDVIALSCALIERESVTPNDAGCQQLMAEYLAEQGFNHESLVFHDTTNMWLRRGHKAPLFCFAGHTDVVPTGDVALWQTPPFTPTIINNTLYGRGAADMKGSLAAMLVATKRFVQENPDHQGSISFLITSDEEGPFINGTTKVIDILQARDEHIDWCVVGEPSSQQQVGDIIKNGRRGSISAKLVVHGKQGHVAYPEHVINPIHLLTPVLTELSQLSWDQGNEYFPATSFQLTNVQSGTGATNVVPATATAWFNLRFSSELNFNTIVERVETVLAKHQLNYDIEWTYNGKPFLTTPDKLLDATVNAVTKVTGKAPQLSTSGGTSDGRFIAPTGAQVIELGPVNKTIHQVNECVSCEELEQLSQMYYHLLVNLLANTDE